MLRREDWLMIQAKRQNGLYIKDISAELGVHARTVRRALKRSGAPSGKRPRARRSKLDPYKATVDRLLAENVWNAVVILRAIEAEGYAGEISIVRDYEGTTENARVATALLADLVARGLDVERVMLFVIDGAKALRRAIREVFGELGIVQRCQMHKLRNVLEHLPQHLHPSITRALHDAWTSDSVDLAQRQLERLAKSLERQHPGAAASLREGLQEILTVQRLGLAGALARTLKTTNPIENLNGSIATYIRNVKRWRHGAMIQRWVAAALREAQKRFRRVRGYRDMPRLIAALDAIRKSETHIAMIA